MVDQKKNKVWRTAKLHKYSISVNNSRRYDLQLNGSAQPGQGRSNRGTVDWKGIERNGAGKTWGECVSSCDEGDVGREGDDGISLLA